MRIVDAPVVRVQADRRHQARAIDIELLGLVACTAVVVFGILLTYWGRTARTADEGANPASLLLLTSLPSPDALEPLLTMFEEPVERRAVAQALHARATAAEPRLDHVGGLAGVTIPAPVVRGNAGFVELGSRLARRPTLAAVPVLSATDLAVIKPFVAVRRGTDARRAALAAATWLVAAFWAAHLFRRWRRVDDEPLLLPLLLMLCGLGLMSMLALRDPLRDTMIFSGFVTGAVGGLLLLLALSEIDFEASRARRAVLPPLAAAFALATLLLLFGSGPGSSGAKVNLARFQPVEAIRVLVIFALAAYFARRLDFLRELSGRPLASRRWLRRIRLPRSKDLAPIVVSMGLVLLFFFLQKDLGPALVMSCVFLGLYGIARGGAVLVAIGGALLIAGFAAAYAAGMPATVMQRVAIWLDPWNNGVAGGNQIAHGLWALASGGWFGLGPGLGSPQVIPAGHTDFVLAVVGEELGLVGVLAIVALYVLLCWRCMRIALRAPGDYAALLVIGLTLALVAQALVIASGLLGLIPLSGVVTPFLSFGKSSMLANFAGLGVVLAVARRKAAPREHLRKPIRVLNGVLAVAAVTLVARAAWIQGPRADTFATAASVGEQGDGGFRFEYNPRLLAAARQIPRGSIYDRNGLPLATSRADEIAALPAVYGKAGLDLVEACEPQTSRCYPLGGLGFHLLGDWRSQINWGAPNSSYVERDRAPVLQGYDDRPRLVDVIQPRSGATARVVRRDYAELLPLVRNRYRPSHGKVAALLARDRDVRLTIDARLQSRVASSLRRRIDADRKSSGSAVVLDSATGEVLAAISYPWPSGGEVAVHASAADARERLFDRSRYGLYPPGSIFKLVVAGAALRNDTEATFACVRLPDGRVGNHVRGTARPVRDDLLDTQPHGAVDLRKGVVASCNAYFAQLAVRLGARSLLDASALFQIEPARISTPAGLQSTLAHAGYGQGEVVVSPLKMARVAAAVASGGEVRPVRWDRAPGPTAAAVRFLSPSDAARLGRHMRDVVTSGTGRALNVNPTATAGKTGTAEVGTGPAHSWFVGFAPYDDTAARRVAFAVIVEHAGYGARSAAPVASEIVTAARELGLFR